MIDSAAFLRYYYIALISIIGVVSLHFDPNQSRLRKVIMFKFKNYQQKNTDEERNCISSNLNEWKGNIAKKNGDLKRITNSITFSWYNITAYTRHEFNEHYHPLLCWCSNDNKGKGNPILDNVSGIAYPGKLLVMMGASGAGKTTLLNCITFRNTKALEITGLVQINHKPTTQKELSTRSAYVQQVDLFVPSLTVREHMIFQARLRLGSEYSHDEKLKKIEEILTELSLIKCQDVAIGLPGVTKGISGGEKKRLALASELLMNPSLLFCDEPTSGLDSFMALNVLQTLKALAMSGRTVICTLHQPSSELFQLFDTICLMAEGRTAFLGSKEEANYFFNRLGEPCPPNYSLGDHYIKILSVIPDQELASKKNIRYISDAFANSSMGKKIRKVRELGGTQWKDTSYIPTTYKVGWFEQFYVLLWRCWLAISRNHKITTINFYSYLGLAILMGALYANQKLDSQGVKNISGAWFLILTNATFKNIAAVITTFCTELPLFLREHKNGLYRIDVYYLTKSLADLPWFSAFNVMFTGICYVIIRMNSEPDRFIIAIILTLLITYTVQGFGYVLSAISSNVVIAQQLTAGVIAPFVILGGYFLDINSIPFYLAWVSDFSWFKWGNSALMINQWYGVTNINCTETIGNCLSNGDEVLQQFGIVAEGANAIMEFYKAVFMLIVLCIISRLAAFLILLYKTYNHDG